jgi:hypothetical protein
MGWIRATDVIAAMPGYAQRPDRIGLTAFDRLVCDGGRDVALLRWRRSLLSAGAIRLLWRLLRRVV